MAEREPSDTLQEIREKLERYANPLPCACEENDEECYCMTMPTPPFSRDEAASLLSRLSTLEAADASDWNRLDAAEEQVAALQAELEAKQEALRWSGEIIGELLDRGQFDPLLPFESVRAFQIKRPVRTHDTQKVWEAELAVAAALADAGSSAPPPEARIVAALEARGVRMSAFDTPETGVANSADYAEIRTALRELYERSSENDTYTFYAADRALARLEERATLTSPAREAAREEGDETSA